MNAPPTIFTSSLSYSPYWKHPHPSHLKLHPLFAHQTPSTIFTLSPTYHSHLKPHPSMAEANTMFPWSG